MATSAPPIATTTSSAPLSTTSTTSGVTQLASPTFMVAPTEASNRTESEAAGEGCLGDGYGVTLYLQSPGGERLR
jgi:hypothetical protein